MGKGIMHVCFINPPIEDFYVTSIRRQPLGILYLISAIRNSDYLISFINGHSSKKKSLPLPKQFQYLKPHMQNKSFPFKNYSHFGMSYQEIKAQIKRLKATVYCVSAMFTPYYEEVITIINIIKELQEEAVIIVGGYHASCYPEFFLNHGVDFVINGEGEETLPLLLAAIDMGNNTSFNVLNTIPNLVFNYNSSVMATTRKKIDNLDSLTPPDLQFLKIRDLKMYNKKVLSLISSRGCPHNCTFCTGKTIWGLGYRTRSIDSIINEIDVAINKYDISILNFEDDNIFAYPQRSYELLKAFISFRKRSGSIFECAAMNGTSIENLNSDMISLMKKAGFNELNISLVSKSSELQSYYGRPFDTSHFYKIVQSAKAHSIHVRVYIIVGLPTQTKEELNETIHYLKELQVKIFPSVYYNVQAPEKEWKMQRSSAFYNETEHLSRADLISFFNKCYLLA